MKLKSEMPSFGIDNFFLFLPNNSNSLTFPSVAFGGSEPVLLHTTEKTSYLGGC